MLLALHRDNWWPSEIKALVTSFHHELLASKSMETLIESEPFISIAVELEKFIHQHTFVGYHCTKEPHGGYFESNGLRILNRASHQAEFIERFGSYFSAEEQTQIQEDWNCYFSGQQEVSRNSRLWFCFAPDQVIGPGTRNFFTYIGGEAVFMPIKHRVSIEQKLRTIGNPVVVEVAVLPKELHTSSCVPFAINALSLYHRRFNPLASIQSREGYMMRDVAHHEVIRVSPKHSFFATYAG